MPIRKHIKHRNRRKNHHQIKKLATKFEPVKKTGIRKILFQQTKLIFILAVFNRIRALFLDILNFDKITFHIYFCHLVKNYFNFLLSHHWKTISLVNMTKRFFDPCLLLEPVAHDSQAVYQVTSQKIQPCLRIEKTIVL